MQVTCLLSQFIKVDSDHNTKRVIVEHKIRNLSEERIENLSKRPEVGLYQPLDYKGVHKNVKRGKGEGEINLMTNSFYSICQIS